MLSTAPTGSRWCAGVCARKKRGSFPLKGSDWFERTAELSEEDWKSDLILLDQEHCKLRAAVERAPEAVLNGPANREFTMIQMIQGAAFHDAYHAGQIRLLRRMLENSDS